MGDTSGKINMKHDKVMSTMDMSFSTSSSDYKNGKMKIEVRRNLPKTLQTTVDMALNDKRMFNMNAIYKKQKDIDMNVDITEPSGSKIILSGNINLSGNKKTSKVEMKSKYINFSADG